MGLWGNILVKLNIPKSKFYNIFDIRRSYSQNIQNMRKIYLLGYSVQGLLGKSLEISRSISIGPHQNNILNGCLSFRAMSSISF